MKIKQITVQTKEKKRTPKLRFKEFEGEWGSAKFGKLAEFKNGLNFSKEQEGDGLKVIGVGDFKNHMSISYDELSKVNVPENQKQAYLLKNNDILFVRSNGNKKLIGRALFLNNVKEELGYSGFTIRARFNEELDIHPYFYAIYFKSSAPKQQFLLLGGGSNISNLNQQILSGLRMPKPSLPEQQKIAAFLSAVDKKIQQLTKKAALLEQYKKGVMQQLFSGELRFKNENGEAYPDWEEKTFGDLYSFHSTNSLSRDKLNYESGTVYNIHYGDIHTKFKTAFNLEEERIPFVNNAVDLSKIKADSYCKNGDLVMADASEDYADIGKTIELVDLKGEQVLAGLHTFLARPITSRTAIGFFSILLKSWAMRKQIMVIAQGTKVLSLSTGRVRKLKVRLPVIEEQQKIATFLSSIDTKIERVNQQISQSQTFKKGLLQQLFV